MMTIPEITEVLIRADRLGLTTYREGQAAAWKDVLDTAAPQLDKRLATEAVEAIAATVENIPPRGIRARDLIAVSARITEARQGRVPLELPAGMSPAAELRWRQAWVYAVGRGADRQQARAYCEQQTGHRYVPAINSVASHEVKQKLAEFKARFGKQKEEEK